MDFGLSEEQQLLEQTLHRFFEEKCPIARVREHVAGEEKDGDAVALWKELASLGVAGILTGIITGAVALSENGKAGDGCEDGSPCAPENMDHELRALNLAHAATGSFVIAGVGLGLGIILVVVDTRSGSQRAFVTPDGVGVRF